MSTTPPTRQFTAATPDEAIRAALADIYPPRPSASLATTLVFSGEGLTSAAALQDALADIQNQAEVNNGVAVEVELEGWLRTDTGVRVWGTSGIQTHATSQPPLARDIALEKDEEGQWTLTIRDQ